MSRIKNISDGPKPIDELHETQATDAVDEISATEVASVSAATGVAGAQKSDPVSQVASRLRSGEIDVSAAVELLIDHAVAKQSHATTQVKEEIRTLLRRFSADDPQLLAQIRRITQAK